MGVALVKPGLVKDLIIQNPAVPGESKLGSGQSPATTPDFFIKVMRQSHDVYSPSEETTGDSDAQPKWENNLLLYNNVTLQGAMVAAKAIGFKNMIVATKNPITVLHRFDLGGGTNSEWIEIKVLIERVRVRWNRTASYVGLSMMLKMTDMTDEDVTGMEDDN